MSTTEVRSDDATGDASVGNVDMKLEAVVIPVSDVDRAKEFYAEPRVAARRRLRLRQRLPGRPVHAARLAGARSSSARSITSAAPGSAQGLYLIVSDIEAARDELVARGVEVSEVFHAGTPGAQFQPDGTTVASAGRRPSTRSYSSFATFSDPDGNGWLLQEITTRLPGRDRRRRDDVRIRRPTWRARCGARRPPTASTRSAPARRDANWPDWYAAYMVAEQAGDGAADVTRLRRDRHRRRLARRALRRRAGRGRPARRRSSSASSSAASARTGRASRRRRCCARARPCTPRTRRRRRAEVDVEAALAWRDFMVSNYSDAGPGALARRQRHRPAARHRPARRRRASVEVDGVRHTAEHVVLANGADPIVPPVPGPARARGRLDEPRGDRHEGGPAPAARARRRPGRRRDGAGRAPPRRRGGARRGRRARARRASPRRSARRSARSCAATASSSCSACSATAARRDGDDYVLELDDGRELRGDRLLVATGRRPRVDGHRPGDRRHRGRRPRGPGRRAPARRRAAVGDRRRHRHLAADPRRQVPGRGRRREHPRRAARGQLRRRAARRLHRSAGGGGRRDRGALQRDRAAVGACAKTATYTRAYAESNGFLTLLSDGERLTGAYALGPEAGEWLQQATLAIRARVPLDVLRDTIQPFPTFSEIYVDALKALRAEIAGAAASTARPASSPSRASRSSLGQTVVVIGGSAGIGLETARLARAEGADVDPHRPRPRAPATRAGRELGALSTAAFDATDFDRLERFFDELPDADRPRAGHRPRPLLRAAGGDRLRRGAPRRRGASPAAAAGRPQRGGQGPPGRDAALHGRHRRPPHGAGLALDLGAHRRDARPDEEPRARARARSA